MPITGNVAFPVGVIAFNVRLCFDYWLFFDGPSERELLETRGASVYYVMPRRPLRFLFFAG